MKIEILAALKRAGFPLTSVNSIFDRFQAEVAESKIPEMLPNAYQVGGHWYLEPTIEQVLNELGKNFKFLERTDVWGAVGRISGQPKLAIGDTALEALCNLYLEIKKK